MAAASPIQLGALHIHHHLHGPSVGYFGIGLAAAASWVGVPGPGEAALVAGGILAAQGRLDLAELLVVAWLGAAVGGVAGWAVGRHAGRPLLSTEGPLHRQRVAALERGERFFARFGVLAVYFAPSWVAGSTGLRAARFLPANALAACSGRSSSASARTSSDRRSPTSSATSASWGCSCSRRWPSPRWSCGVVAGAR